MSITYDSRSVGISMSSLSLSPSPIRLTATSRRACAAGPPRSVSAHPVQPRPLQLQPLPFRPSHHGVHRDTAGLGEQGDLPQQLASNALCRNPRPHVHLYIRLVFLDGNSGSQPLT